MKKKEIILILIFITLLIVFTYAIYLAKEYAKLNEEVIVIRQGGTKYTYVSPNILSSNFSKKYYIMGPDEAYIMF